jgi:hypothetical protein
MDFCFDMPKEEIVKAWNDGYLRQTGNDRGRVILKAASGFDSAVDRP